MSISRRYVVTGSASGMGKATATLLAGQGHEVIGIDFRNADVVADLSTLDGRAAAIAGVEARAGGVIDALVHCAGIASYIPLTMSVNYFGAVALLGGLLPLLAKGTDPRAVVVTSFASTMAPDPDIVAAALAGDEVKALALGVDKGVTNYT